MNNVRNYVVVFIFIILSIIFICTTFILPKTIPATMFNSVLAENDIKFDNETTAKAMIVIEGNSGRILLGNNINEQLPMASTTKIMTALIALENCENLDEIVAINKNAVGIEGTSIYLRENDKLTMKELLYGLMLASGNDASVAIGYHIGKGNIDDFIAKMNEKAKMLNLKDTHFVNTHGLDIENHYTSAYDLATITREALKNPIFKEICSTKFMQINGNEEVGNRFLRNKQKLFNMTDGCVGVKTGFTDKAGRCNVACVERDNMQLICVVLNCPDMFNECKKQIEKCLDMYTYVQLLPEYHYIDTINIIDGEVDKIKTYTRQNFNYPIKDDEINLITIEKEMLQNIKAPVKKEEIVGELKIMLDNNLIFSEKIYTIDNVDSTLLSEKIKNVLEKWYN